MADQQALPVHPPANANELAFERTALAHERTLMAWIRTAFSMISFGFTILKTFQYLTESKALSDGGLHHGPRNLGATLILLGTISLILATIQHRSFIKRAKEAGHAAAFSLTLTIATLITVVGLLAFVGAFVRTGIF